MVPIRSISALIAAFHDASRSCPVTAECRSLCKRCRRPQLCSKKTKFFFANGSSQESERKPWKVYGLPSSAERFIRGVVLLRNPIPARQAGTTLVANGNSDDEKAQRRARNLKLLALRHSTLEGLAPDRYIYYSATSLSNQPSRTDDADSERTLPTDLGCFGFSFGKESSRSVFCFFLG